MMSLPILLNMCNRYPTSGSALKEQGGLVRRVRSDAHSSGVLHEPRTRPVPRRSFSQADEHEQGGCECQCECQCQWDGRR